MCSSAELKGTQKDTDKNSFQNSPRKYQIEQFQDKSTRYLPFYPVSIKKCENENSKTKIFSDSLQKLNGRQSSF